MATTQTPTAQQLQTLTQSVQNSSAFSPSQRAAALGAIQNAYGSGQSAPPVGSIWNQNTNSWNTPPVTVNVNAKDLGTGTQKMVAGSAPTTAFNQSNITAGNIAGGADVTTGIYNTQVTPTSGQQTQPSSSQEAFNKYISSIQAPTDLTSQYNKAQQEAGLIQAQQYKQNIQNQLNAETTRMNLDLQSLRGTGAKEGVTEAVYGQQSAQVTREASARILPLQAQLAMAQDNLQVAQERTDTLFNMYSKDAQNKVDHWNNLVKANYDYFTTEEKKKLDAQSKIDAYNMTNYKDKIASINNAAQQALKEGNTVLYRSLTNTPPPVYTNSADYAQKMNEWSNTMDANIAKYSPSMTVTSGATNYVPGSNLVVDSWAQKIQNGSAKLTDIPASQANLRNQVVVALQAMGNSADGKPTTTEMGKAALSTAQSLLNKVKEGKGTSAIGRSGLLNSLGYGYIPGTDRANLITDFNSLKSQLSLEGVKYLKGQGQVSDAERALLAQAVTKLDLSQSEDEFKSTLQGIIDKLNGNIPQTQSAQTPTVKDGDTKNWNGVIYKVINGVWTPQ